MNRQTTIRLGGGSIWITNRAEDAYRVRSGRVLVYIVPWDGERAGRRCLLCEATPGEMLPSLVCRDLEYQQWRLCFSALDEAEIEPIPGGCTEEIRLAFLEKTGAGGVGSLEDRLIDRCRMLLLREDGGMILHEEEKEEILARTDRLIAEAMRGSLAPGAAEDFRASSGVQTERPAPVLINKERTPAEDDGASEAYRALALLCRREQIAIAPWEKVLSCCGSDASPKQIARLSGIPCREVLLEENWHRADAGALLVRWGEDGRWGACIPGRRYTLFLPGEAPIRMTKALGEHAAPRALSVQRPFQEGPMDLDGIARYCAMCLHARDFVPAILLCMLCAAAALLLPLLAAVSAGPLARAGLPAPIVQIGLLACVLLLCSGAFSALRERSFLRMQAKLRFAVQCAAYHRAFDLPESAVRSFDSTDLARRVLETGLLAGDAARCAAAALPALVTALVCLIPLFALSPSAALCALAAGAALCALRLVIAQRQAGQKRIEAALDAQADSSLYQILEGISKIRMAGAEERAVYEYLRRYASRRQAASRVQKLTGLDEAACVLCTGLLLLLVWAVGAQGQADAGRYTALLCTAALFLSALQAAASSAAQAVLLGPLSRRVRAFLAHAPESRRGGASAGISGAIELDGVCFAYPDGGDVLHSISLSVRRGEYIGVTGPSGCGKSTLLKLLLGFEQPQQGRILYDGCDMRDLDVAEMRRHFGVVLQEGGLVSGSILDNITLTRPEATLQEAEEAARMAGVLNDIMAMPMQFHTRVSESGSSLSGGQAQRILIARALIGRPDILLFDEATSALDNLNQRTVCETLRTLPCTKIVVAHRLSTVMHCDRILVIDKGRIAQEGTFDELMAKEGPFRALAKGQIEP